MHVVVLREGVHGLAPEAYARKLRDRLPDHEVSLAGTPAEERSLAEEADVITAPEFDVSLPTDGLRLFAGAYAGHGHLPLSELEAGGVAVTNAAGVHAPNVAEHAVGSILAFSRNVPEAVRRGDRAEWRPYPVGELQGSTVTVAGLGNIGAAVVDRLAPFGVETVGVRSSPEKGGPADEVIGPDAFHDALARTDYLVLACPLTEETRGLVDEDAFRTLSSESVLVNVARGPVVETGALVEAVRRGEIAGAALDVTDPEPLPPDHPLWDFENVLVTPHVAGATPNYYDRLAALVADNVERLARGDELRNRVV